MELAMELACIDTSKEEEQLLLREGGVVLDIVNCFPKLSVRSLSRHLDCKIALLSDVSFDVLQGQVVGIIGPSGSGKSTLLRAFNRLWEPASSTVLLDGKDVTQLDVLAVRRSIGMLFQTPCTFGGTVADNIRYGPKLTGRHLEDDCVASLLQQADLDSSFMKRPIRELSPGQLQRVALARTLANDPQVLLLDEPTSALDPVSTQRIESSLIELNRNKGMTMLLVSHSIKQVQRLAHVVILLVGGKVVEVLAPNELDKAKHPLARQFLQAI